MTAQRLLILDDDPMTGETIRRIAEFAGLEVHYTPNPERFFQLLDEWHPTHIALDLVMPEMDGVQVMAKLAHLSCQAKIIITSGVGSRVLDAAGRSAAEHGLDIAGVLAKPFSLSQLRELLTGTPSTDLLQQHPTATRQAVPVPQPVLTVKDLERGLEQREFYLVYQPKVFCETGVLAGVEALVRWQHPQRGIISPIQFIPLAESSGLIDQLTEQIIEQALDWFGPLCTQSSVGSVASLPPEVGVNLKLSLNISAKTLGNVRLFEQVREQCDTLKVYPEQLIFELTETSAMDDPVASLDLLTRLRMMGFHLSIDDFGTGFSSMLQLVRLPFSEIKVDKSFVMTAMKSQESRTVVKFIVDLGHSLGLGCTAEGVEDAATMDYLKLIHCDLAQGYLVARPMAGEELPSWLLQRQLLA